MFLETELALINKQMEYPKFFTLSAKTWKSILYLDLDKINYVDIMEIISSLFYLGCITTFDGKTVPLSQLAKGFERLFNFKFSDIYKKEEEVIKRKPNKLTGFLDRLRETIKRKSKDDGFQS